MGKRSQRRMTGLSEDKRVKRSKRRKAQKKRKIQEERKKLLQQVIRGLGKESWETKHDTH